MDVLSRRVSAAGILLGSSVLAGCLAVAEPRPHPMALGVAWCREPVVPGVTRAWIAERGGERWTARSECPTPTWLGRRPPNPVVGAASPMEEAGASPFRLPRWSWRALEPPLPRASVNEPRWQQSGVRSAGGAEPMRAELAGPGNQGGAR